MKTNSIRTQKGSVLLVALLTITILTLICATSLYITTQNATAGMQTASWQQALTGAESGVDAAMRALNTGNTGVWTNWISKSQNGTNLPTAEPSSAPTTAPTGPPDSSHYYLLPSSALALSVQPGSEGATHVSSWVTVDTAQMSPGSNGRWYRIRSTGVANEPAINRNALGYLDVRFNQRTHPAITGASSGINVSQVTRTIEVVAQPTTTTTSNGTMGIVTRNAFTVGGGSRIDSFNSTDTTNFPNGQYALTAWQSAWNSAQNDLQSGNSTLVAMGTTLANELSGGNVGILNSTGSNLNNGPYIYGSLTYSGPALKGKTKNVYGTISTPFNATVRQVIAPTDTALPLPAPAANGTITVNIPTGTTQGAPVLYQGSLPQNASIVVNSPRDPVTNQLLPGTAYVEISVTGDLYLAGNGSNSNFTQDSHANTAFYVQGNISLAGNSITNGSGLAQNFIVYGVTPTDGSARTASVSGNGTFTGVVDAPAYDISYTGNGDVVGALLGNTLNVSGNGNLHYDEALDSKLGFFSSAATYSFASWFEDTSNVNRKVVDQNGNYKAIVY
jgi:hypothetical protein